MKEKKRTRWGWLTLEGVSHHLVQIEEAKRDKRCSRSAEPGKRGSEREVRVWRVLFRWIGDR